MTVKVRYSDELYHHGILGQKWGIRRFQNPDGSLTPEGMKRYGRGSGRNRLNSRQKQAISALKESYSIRMPDQIFSVLGADSKVLLDVRKNFRSYDRKTESIIKEFENNKTISDYINYQNASSSDDYRKLHKKFWQGVSKEDRYRLYAESEIANSIPYRKNTTMEDIVWDIYDGCYEDGQQGDITAMTMHAAESIPKDLANKIISLNKERSTINRNAQDKIKKELSKYMGDDPDVDWLASTITERLRKSVKPNNRDDDDAFWSEYLLYGLGDNLPETNENIKTAKEIVKNLNGTHPSSWREIYQITQELGLSDKKSSDMTAEDWAKMREELNKVSRPSWWDKNDY